MINGLGALVSAIPHQTPSNVSHMATTILPRLAVGDLNVWWIYDVGAYWPLATAAVIGVSMAIPLAWYGVVRKRDAASWVPSA